MLKLPKKVKIGAHTYEVVVTDDIFGSEELGKCLSITQKILILKGLSDTQTFSVFLHEAIHAMNTTIDHALMDSLAEQISQFLLDNKLLR